MKSIATKLITLAIVSFAAFGQSPELVKNFLNVKEGMKASTMSVGTNPDNAPLGIVPLTSEVAQEASVVPLTSWVNPESLKSINAYFTHNVTETESVEPQQFNDMLDMIQVINNRTQTAPIIARNTTVYVEMKDYYFLVDKQSSKNATFVHPGFLAGTLSKPISGEYKTMTVEAGVPMVVEGDKVVIGSNMEVERLGFTTTIRNFFKPVDVVKQAISTKYHYRELEDPKLVEYVKSSLQKHAVPLSNLTEIEQRWEASKSAKVVGQYNLISVLEDLSQHMNEHESSASMIRLVDRYTQQLKFISRVVGKDFHLRTYESTGRHIGFVWKRNEYQHNYFTYVQIRPSHYHDFVTTLLHEVTHMLTLSKYIPDAYYSMYKQEIEQARRPIESFYRYYEAQKKLLGVVIADILPDLSHLSADERKAYNALEMYGFTNADECMAEGLTNPKFQRALNSIPSLLARDIGYEYLLPEDQLKITRRCSMLDSLCYAVLESMNLPTNLFSPMMAVIINTEHIIDYERDVLYKTHYGINLSLYDPQTREDLVKAPVTEYRTVLYANMLEQSYKYKHDKTGKLHCSTKRTDKHITKVIVEHSVPYLYTSDTELTLYGQFSIDQEQLDDKFVYILRPTTISYW